MSAIKSKNTKPELVIRKSLHAAGFRFRLHRKDLPGKPDLVLPKYRAAIFVHGCFWHGHNCYLFKLPASRTEFWLEKINGNQRRDKLNLQKLVDAGWRVLTIWECSLKGPRRLDSQNLMSRISEWIKSGDELESISCNSDFPSD